MGADDRMLEGDFRWSDGSPLLIDDPAWKIGQPDNAHGNEDCVDYLADLKRLNDSPCSIDKSFVCQIDI